MNFRQYRPKYGEPMVTKTIHQCKVCELEFALNDVDASEHLSKKHGGMSVKKYYTKYIMMQNTQEAGHLEGEDKLENSVVAATKNADGNKDTDTEKLVNASKSASSETGIFSQSRAWVNKCKFKCRICFTEMKSKIKFGHHIRQTHNQR